MDCDRSVDQSNRCGWIIFLKFNHTQQMQGVSILWVLRENFEIQRCRFGKLAFLMKGEGVLKHRTGPAFDLTRLTVLEGREIRQ